MLDESDLGWCSVKRAAILAEASQKHIRRAMQCGKLEYSDISLSDGRPTYRISRLDLVKWIKERKVKRSPETTARNELVDKYFPKRTKQ